MALTSGTDGLARAERLTTAAEAALERLASAERTLSPAGVFAPLGEALSWLIALDDLLRHNDPGYEAYRDNDAAGGHLRGLRYARAAVLHGHDVAAMAEVQPGSQPGALVLGTRASQLGMRPRLTWAARSAIPFKRREDGPAYDRIAGSDLRPPLQQALAFLRAIAGT